MKNSIRCCISCILPCGALDVIRIVHSNGSVEEISGSIRAGDIMKTYPKHVLRKATSPSNEEMLPKIVIVSPETELQRGKIYFLMRVSSSPDRRIRSKTSTRKKKQKELECNSATSDDSTTSMSTKLLSSDHYLNEILSEKVSTQRDRRRGRVGVWRPHLESITELPADFYE